MVKKQAKQVAQVQATEKTAQVSCVDVIINTVNEIAKTNQLVSMQKVTGYTALKYANKTFCELHIKKKSISHITFASASKAYEIAKQNKCILRVVPKSFGWRLDTEVLCTNDNAKYIIEIINCTINEIEKQRNLKQTKKA